ncbi:MAG TPA: hypothetical protein VI322_05300 [Candidatus Saccharimonadia bacterium]
MGLLERFGRTAEKQEQPSPVAELHVSPEQEVLRRSAPAPTLENLATNPVEILKRSTHNVLVVRNDALDRLSDEGKLPHELREDYASDHLVGYSEAELVQNLYDRLNELKSLFDTYGGERYQEFSETAERMAKDLRFIGEPEYQHGTETIVRALTDRLADSNGPLYVGIRPGRSSAYVFESISRHMHETNPDFEQRLVTFNLEKPIEDQQAAKFAQDGVVIVDDWSITGSQMRHAVGNLLASGVPPEAVSVNLICATDKQLLEGFDGVHTEAAYQYPHQEGVGGYNNNYATLTGAHGDNDYGFRNTLNWLYTGLDYLRSEREFPASQNVSQPLLARIARTYREEQLPAHTENASETAYHEHCEQHTRFITERLKHDAEQLAA